MATECYIDLGTHGRLALGQAMTNPQSGQQHLLLPPAVKIALLQTGLVVSHEVNHQSVACIPVLCRNHRQQRRQWLIQDIVRGIGAMDSWRISDDTPGLNLLPDTITELFEQHSQQNTIQIEDLARPGARQALDNIAFKLHLLYKTLSGTTSSLSLPEPTGTAPSMTTAARQVAFYKYREALANSGLGDAYGHCLAVRAVQDWSRQQINYTIDNRPLQRVLTLAR